MTHSDEQSQFVDPRPYGLYVRNVGLGVAAILLVMAVLNVLADPFAWRDDHRLVQPDVTTHGREVILNMAGRAHPDIVALGTSRTGAAWGSGEPAFRGRAFFNASVPGGTIGEVASIAEYLTQGPHHPQEFLLGTYLLHTQTTATLSPASIFIHWNLVSRHQSLTDIPNYLAYVFSFDALRSSFRTVIREYVARYPPQIRADGQQLPYNFVHGVEVVGGPYAASRQPELPTTRSDLTRYARELDRFLAAACRVRAPVKLVIEPMHVIYFEWIEQTGHWSDFLEWQRQIAQRSRDGQCPVEVWSFTDMDAVSTDALPQIDAPMRPMTYWFDLVHFSPQVGSWMLHTMYGTGESGPAGFGQKLNSENFAAYAQRLQAHYQAFAVLDKGSKHSVAEVMRGILRRQAHEGGS